MERFSDSFEQYKNLIKNYEDDYEDERESNLSAVVAKICLTSPDSLDNVPDLGEQTYELCFNKACIEIGRRNYSKALKLLNLAAGETSLSSTIWYLSFACFRQMPRYVERRGSE